MGKQGGGKHKHHVRISASWALVLVLTYCVSRLLLLLACFLSFSLLGVYRDVNEFLRHILKSTNMACLTPEYALTGDCGFLSANLYARSVFGACRCVRVCIIKSHINLVFR